MKLNKRIASGIITFVAAYIFIFSPLEANALTKMDVIYLTGQSKVSNNLDSEYLKNKSKITILVNGQELYTDTPVFSANERTMLPVRAIAESLGAEVSYEPDGLKEIILIKKGQDAVILQMNKNKSIVNGTEKQIDSSPKVSASTFRGRTYLPIRFVAENLGIKIDWRSSDKTVVISSDSTVPLTTNSTSTFNGYKQIEVDGGDLSGHREAKVVVDIGFGDRKYYAFTNEYGQLVKVVADRIILQDSSTEPVNSSGRYYPDEAKVPGVESPNLDEGHIIADSLGGVANAYNITPQNSTLNRHGDQAYMEKVIRDAGGCTDFVAIITYPNTKTQIPSHYSYTYTIKGNVINDEFDNVNPDEVNAAINNVSTAGTVSTVKPQASTSTAVKISTLDKKAEYIVLKNTGSTKVNLSGWKVLSVKGSQTFTFPDYILSPNTTVKVGDSSKNTVDLHWMEGKGVWNNSESDPAEIYDNAGKLVDRLEN